MNSMKQQGRGCGRALYTAWVSDRAGLATQTQLQTALHLFLPWALLYRKSRGSMRWGESDSLLMINWVMAAWGRGLLIHRKSCLWLNARVWRPGWKDMLQACVVCDGRASPPRHLHPGSLFFLCHMLCPRSPYVCKLETQDQIIPNSSFYLFYVCGQKMHSEPSLPGALDAKLDISGKDRESKELRLLWHERQN